MVEGKGLCYNKRQVMRMNYVLYGEERYLLQKALQNIIAKYVLEKNEFTNISYDARTTDIQIILEDASTIPFFSEQKVILIHHANFLSTNNDTDMDTDALELYLDNPMESTTLILLGDFEKLDARKKIVKKIKKVCEVLQFRKLDQQGKQSYIKEELKKRTLSVDNAGLQELIQRLPLDIQSIHMELDKLELYGDTITYDVVSKLVTRPLEDDVFLLVRAVVDKDVKTAFHIWQDLCVLNKDAIYLIALLASQFRFLYEVKALMMQSKRKDEIVSILSAHPYRVQMSMQSAKDLDIAYLMGILEQLATLDQRMKAGLLDKKLGFEMFLLRIQGA